MKHLFILVSLLFAGIFSFAQNKNNATTASVMKPSTEAIATSFEAELVSGSLSFIKTFKKGNGKEFIPVYSLSKNDVYFNGRKPIPISLSKQSFDSVFTKTTSDLAGKWATMNKYIESNKISLTEEKGWINVISYFNGL